MHMIKVLVVENKEKWFQKLQEYAEDNERIDFVACAKSKDEAVLFLERNKVDMIVMDIELEDATDGGTSLAKAIRRISKARIIVLTSRCDIQKEVIRVGVSGYLLKQQIDQMIRTIEEIYDGYYPYEEVLMEYNKYRLMAEISVLTHAERMILKFLLEGCSISQISIQCHTSENTVKKQINSIYRKLNIQSVVSSSRSQLMERYRDALTFL